MLAAWFGTYWVGAPWKVLPREQLVAKGRQFTKLFGLDVSDWKPYVVANLSKSLLRYGKGVTPLSVRITYVSRKGRQTAEVGFDSSGLPVYWSPPDHYKPPGVSGSSEDVAANAAFRILAGAEAGAYETPIRSVGDDVHEQNYLWRKRSSPDVAITDRIKVLTKGNLVTSAEHRVFLASDKDDDSEAEDDRRYWGIFGGIFGLTCTVGILAIAAIYVLWLARKAVSNKFPLRAAGAALLLMLVAMAFGSGWQESRSVSRHDDLPVIPALVMAVVVLSFVAVGRGISVSARPKWMSLEQLCRLAPVSKAAGESIAAGVLFGPLLAAIPFLIVGCRLFPQAWVLPQNAALLYSNSPLLDSSNMSSEISLLGFFGFGLPALERLIRPRWLRWCFAAPIGTIFFADRVRVVSGPVAAPLVAGLLTLLLFWFVWAHSDILSILSLQLAGYLVTGSLMLAQKGGHFWSPAAGFAGLLLAALWIYQRGQPVSAGDPLATAPALSGFRAEREKLQAEFSLARRAQQDMLPPTPGLAGYSIAASCTPSLEVGGDLYDFLRLADGRIGIGVADVSGKGVPAALYMTLTKGLLASVAKDSSDLIPVVEEVNRLLHSVTRKKVFVTMALGFLDPGKRVLQFVRAGHNPIVWRQTIRDETTLISPGGLGLGITASKVFSAQLKVAEMILSEGDAVVFYSDGITEAMNSGLELFGEERLMNAVKRTDALDASAARDSILSEVRDFLGGVHPQDDMTLVVLRVGASEKLGENGTEWGGASLRG